MALQHAPICTRCGKTRTLHPSGVCSHCRRRPAPQQPCRLCGDRQTNHETGLCAQCRRSQPNYDKLDAAIDHCKRMVSILELRKQGLSFGDISDAVGLSKSATFESFRRALHMPLREVYPEEN